MKTKTKTKKKTKAQSKSRGPGTVAIDASAVKAPVEPVDPEVEDEFRSVAVPPPATARQLHEKLAEHHSQSPKLTAGDVDAAWDRSDVGEEGPGGSVSTPDQAVVEEIGEALGLTFEDDEPVDTPGKLARRDRKRFELDPISSEDYPERQQKTTPPTKR